MNRAWKIIGVIAAVLVISVVAFGAVWIGRNWKVVYNTFDGGNIYTDSDMQESYQEGYEAGSKNDVKYQSMITELRDVVSGLQVENTNLIDEASLLKYAIDEHLSEIKLLSEQKAGLEKQLVDLENVNSKNIELKNQISDLEKHIAELTLAKQLDESKLSELNNKIAQLEDNIVSYQNYIANNKSEDQAVVIYELAGRILDIQNIEKGSSIVLPEPESTDNYIFNAWQLDGVNVTSPYTINTNTKFVADVTYKYTVNFVVGDQIYQTQNILQNSFAEVPSEPLDVDQTITEREFVGWSLNGVDIIENIDQIPVVANTTYYAVFVNIYTVTFRDIDGSVIGTQKVRDKGYIIRVPDAPEKADYSFIGWYLTGRDVVTRDAIQSIPVVRDISYSAKYAKIHTVKLVFNLSEISKLNSSLSGEIVVLEKRIVDGGHITEEEAYNAMKKIKSLFEQYINEENRQHSYPAYWTTDGYVRYIDDSDLVDGYAKFYDVNFAEYEIHSDKVFYPKFYISIDDLPEKSVGDLGNY